MANNTMRGGIILPTPTEEYSMNYMGNLTQSIAQNDISVQKIGQDYILSGIANTTNSRISRLILRSPDGTYFQILIDDTGTLSTLNIGTSI